MRGFSDRDLAGQLLEHDLDPVERIDRELCHARAKILRLGGRFEDEHFTADSFVWCQALDVECLSGDCEAFERIDVIVLGLSGQIFDFGVVLVEATQ